MLKDNSKGISLLEAFLAAFIFIVSVSAVFVTLTAMRKPAVNNDQATSAALAGSQILDDLRARISTCSLLANGEYTGDLGTGTHLYTGMGPGGIYNVLVNIIPDGLNPGAVTVEANVTWPDAF